MAAQEAKSHNYNLKWTNHTSNMVQMIAEHLHKESLVDVTLWCEGQYIKAHKIVLSACSSYFEELFSVHTAEHPYIILSGVKYITLQQLIDFMYEGEIRVSDEDLETLLTTSEYFEVKGLCRLRKERAASFENDEVIKNSPPSTEAQNNTNKNESPPKSRKRRKQLHSPILNQSVEGTSAEPLFSTLKTNNPNVDDDSKLEAKLSKSSTKQGNSTQEIQVNDKTIPVPKIPRPLNAFMVFANEWRKKLAMEHQGENNKDISVRLGIMWNSLPSVTKDLYYSASKKANEEHKAKYPGYYYSPKEARIRKERRANYNSQKTSNILSNSTGIIKDIDTASLVTLVMPDTTDEIDDEIMSCDEIKEELECLDDLFESDSTESSGDTSPNSQLPSSSNTTKQ